MLRLRAFTLIELLVVISIIGLLSSVVLASLNAARDKGRIAAGKQFAASVDHIAGDYAMGLWDFDECSGSTTVDRSGEGINGILNGPIVWSTDTPFSVGCSLQFNGSNTYVALSRVTVDVNYSITAWVKTTMSGSGAVLDNISCGGPACVGFHVSNGKTRLGYDFGPGIQGVQTITDGKWNQIAVTFDGTNTKLYVNGTLDITSAAQGARSMSTNCGSIGLYYRCGGGNGNWYNGLIDSVHLFAKTLTAEEVGKMYAEAKKPDLAKN